MERFEAYLEVKSIRFGDESRVRFEGKVGDKNNPTFFRRATEQIIGVFY